MGTYSVMYREKGAGAILHGKFNSHSEALLRQEFMAAGRTVLLIQASKSTVLRGIWEKASKASLQMPRFGVSTSELALLCEVFKALYASGEQMLKIVEMSLEETPNPWLRKKLAIVLEHLKVGDSLAVAMSDKRCRRAFPQLMVETIRTGEENGNLDGALARLVDTFKRMADTKRETTSALVYPAFTLVVFLGVCTILAVMIPGALNQFVGRDMIDKFRQQLPIAIRLLFFLHDNPAYLIFPPALIVAICFLWRIGMKFESTRYMLTWVQRHVPLFGKLLEDFALVRFLEVLSANHESGVDIGRSLALVRSTVGEAFIERSIDRVRDNILQNGVSLADAMDEPWERKIFPGLIRQMIRAGSESGRFAEMVRPIMVFYDEQARARLKRMLDLLTPAMIVVLGSVVGPIVLGVYKTITLMNDAMVGGFGG